MKANPFLAKIFAVVLLLFPSALFAETQTTNANNATTTALPITSQTAAQPGPPLATTPAANSADASPAPVPTPMPSALRPPTVTPAAPNIDAKAYILMDADSGYIIAQKSASDRMAPASLTKLMTMYVISGALKNGQIRLTDMVPISEEAWRTGGSRMFIKVGSQVAVQDLVNGIVVASGNDACVAMAEFVSGTPQAFVDLMNKTAANLGLTNTHFTDVNGLPDPNHYSSPYDLAMLTRAIIYNYPEDYKWYSQKWFTFNNIKQPNRNRLLWRDSTVDGLKTGHTEEAGFCLVASAKRNDMRLIAVVMGAPTDNARANDTQALLTYGFRFFETHQLYTANTPLATPRVWMGENKTTPFGLAKGLYVTIPNGQYNKLKASMTLDQPSLQAPIAKGQQYGTVQVMLNDQVIASQPLVALEDNPRGGVFARLGDHISLLISHMFSKS